MIQYIITMHNEPLWFYICIYRFNISEILRIIIYTLYEFYQSLIGLEEEIYIYSKQFFLKKQFYFYYNFLLEVEFCLSCLKNLKIYNYFN